MAISFHPARGTILICDFKGTIAPEMTKRRPVVVVSPRFRERHRLCTVVPLSTTPPKEAQNYHLKITLNPCLPAPYDEEVMWAKADMLSVVSFDRLWLFSSRKDENQKRVYEKRVLSDTEMDRLMGCVLHGLGVKI